MIPIDVFDKAKELGNAILESVVFDKLCRAEVAMLNDKEASNILNEHKAKEQEFYDISSVPDGSRNKREIVISELRNLEERMERNELISTYMKCQDDFNRFMTQINQIIQYCVTGEMSQDGSCSAKGCGGCSRCHK